MTSVPLKALPIVPPSVPGNVEVIAIATYLSEWEEIAREYEAEPEDVGHAFLYLAQHPAFWDVREGTDVPYYLMPGSAWYRSIELGVWREARTDRPLV